MKNLQEILNSFQNKHILVIGDIILDKYIFGDVERISPEAPVPIVKINDERFVPGGAANVSANISTLGGKATLIGVTGQDKSREILLNKINEFNVETKNILSFRTRKTIQKIRVISQNQQLLRIDYEDNIYLSNEEETQLIKIIENLKDYDAVIISDYAKGTLTKKIIEKAISFSKERNIPIIIDPKPKHKNWYKNTTCITPNKSETEAIIGEKIYTEKDFIKAGEKLKKIFNSNVVLTAGPNGMYVFRKDFKEYRHIKTTAKEVYDVSGAGDTVVATLSLAISSKADLYDATILSNVAAGIKVSKFGTAQITKEEIIRNI